jgi:hypothetical protein
MRALNHDFVTVNRAFWLAGSTAFSIRRSLGDDESHFNLDA